jgi:hypothetical protein
MNTPSPAAAGPVNGPLARIAQGWSRFWFAAADPTPLGLIRICAGLIVLYVHLAYTVDLQEFLGPHAWSDLRSANEWRDQENGVPWFARPWDWSELEPTPPEVPRSPEERDNLQKWGRARLDSAVARGYPIYSIWFQVTDPRWMLPVHVTLLVIMFLFTIGFCTRVTSVLTWLAALSYIQRSQVTLFGMDTIINVLLLYLMIGPSGAALSVDRLLLRYWYTRRVLSARARKAGHALYHAPLEGPPPPAPRISANLALRLMQVHICFIYLASGLSKLMGNAWWTGTAVWGTMANPEFSPIHFPLYLPFLQFLAQHRFLWEVAMGIPVLFTLLFEISFAFVVWYRSMRWVMIISAVLLHTGIAVFMGLNTFSLAMITLVISFVPAEAVHRFLEMLSRGPGGFQLRFNARSRGQVRAASLVHAIDAGSQVQLSEAGSDVHALQLATPTGEVFTGSALFDHLVRSLRLLWPLKLVAWVPGLDRLGRALFSDDPAALSYAIRADLEKHKAKGEKVRS